MSVIEGALFRAGVSQNPDAKIIQIAAGDGELNTALADCRDSKGDIIIVGPGSHSVTEIVDFNKLGVIVIAADYGMNPDGRGEDFTVNCAASLDDSPAAQITQPCSIYGLGFAARDTTGPSLLFDCDETGGYNAGFNYLKHCRFSAWYGAMTNFIKFIGGSLNTLEECTFDGLFGGVGTAAISLNNDTGGLATAYLKVLNCTFQGMGSGKHAIKHETGSVPVGLLYHGNWLLPGFAGDAGKFLDNNNVASTGECSDNHLGACANKAGAFENLTNSSLKFSNNHYAET